MPEVVGSSSVLVDPLSVDSIGDGIKQALSNPQKYKEAGLAQAKKFTWEKTARAVMEVYEKIANRD